MIVNWHGHVYPPEDLAARQWSGRSPFALDSYLDIHAAAGVDLSVVSNTIHSLAGLPMDRALAGVQRWDEYAAEVQRRHPDRVVAFASTIPGGGDGFLAELERAVTEYHLKGVLINSSHDGVYPDADAARPFWELVSRLGIPVFLHAPRTGPGEEHMRDYRLASSVGRPFDECLSLARLIVRGVLEQFPDVTIVGAHLGGGICEVVGRLDYAYELRDEAAFLGPYEPMRITRPPSEYLRQLYFDTVSYHAPALMCAVATVGADHLVLGADAPPLSPLLPRAIDLVQRLPLSPDEIAAISAGNALRLLGIDRP
ncbi:amidohydrolase family protein [Dactylosporangium sp. NPDC049525]|uniref:amidohydrolase family protein n=1 Tax=Dactylosporangium sp. NPDC049525 TaxID=3154730 RepID=UPI0034472027